MSVEQSQSERIVKLEETNAILVASNAALSNMVTQMWKEIIDLKCQLSNRETPLPGAPLTSIASATRESSACGAEDSLPDQIEAISVLNTLQKQMAILEEANGVLETSSTQLLEKVTQMQQVVDDLRASNDKLTDYNTALNASNNKLIASNKNLTRRISTLEMSDRSQTLSIDKLTDSNGKLNVSTYELRATNMNLTRQISALEMSVAGCQKACTDVQVLLNVSSPLPTPTAISTEDIEALSKMLLKAAQEGNAQRVRQLVAEGAHLEYRDENNKTALHLAAQFRHVEVLKTLIELGARLEARQNQGRTPLYYAIEFKHEKCVRLLFLAGASVHARDKWGSTPLHHTAIFGISSIVKMLIDAGADREAKNNSGQTPKDVAKGIAIRALL